MKLTQVAPTEQSAQAVSHDCLAKLVSARTGTLRGMSLPLAPKALL